jgi:hypothetical protein
MSAPDFARDLAEIDAAIDRVVAAHQVATGKSRFHLGRCGRADLHQQLVALHARKQAVTAAIASQSQQASESSEKLGADA